MLIKEDNSHSNLSLLIDQSNRRASIEKTVEESVEQTKNITIGDWVRAIVFLIIFWSMVFLIFKMWNQNRLQEIQEPSGTLFGGGIIYNIAQRIQKGRLTDPNGAKWPRFDPGYIIELGDVTIDGVEYIVYEVQSYVYTQSTEYGQLTGVWRNFTYKIKIYRKVNTWDLYTIEEPEDSLSLEY